MRASRGPLGTTARSRSRSNNFRSETSTTAWLTMSSFELVGRALVWSRHNNTTGGNVQDSKLQFLDDFRDTVNDLGLAQVDLRSFWRLHRSCHSRSMAKRRRLDKSRLRAVAAGRDEELLRERSLAGSSTHTRQKGTSENGGEEIPGPRKALTVERCGRCLRRITHGPRRGWPRTFSAAKLQLRPLHPNLRTM